MFLGFWLWNVLCATRARNFSSLIWPNGSSPAALASLLFDPPEPQIIGKTEWIATFLPFRTLHLLSSDSFSSLIFSLLLFSSLNLSTSAFPSVHIVGSLTSKLPSTNMWWYNILYVSQRSQMYIISYLDTTVLSLYSIILHTYHLPLISDN